MKKIIDIYFYFYAKISSLFLLDENLTFCSIKMYIILISFDYFSW